MSSQFVSEVCFSSMPRAVTVLYEKMMKKKKGF